MVAGGGPPQLRVADQPGAAARPRLRDRVGQGQQRPAPTTTPRWPPRAGATVAGLDAATSWRASSAATRRSSATRAGWTWRTSCCCTAGDAGRGRAGRGRRSARQYKWFVVDEFQDVSPDPVGPARPLARRPRRDLRGRRPGPDDLLLRRAPTPTTCATSRASSPAPPRSSSVRNYRSTPEVVEAANTVLAGVAEPPRCGCGPSAPPGPAVRWHAGHRRGRRGRGRGRGRSAGCVADGAPTCARSPCCSGSTPSPRPSRRRWPRAASPTSCAAPPGSSSAARCGRR